MAKTPSKSTGKEADAPAATSSAKKTKTRNLHAFFGGGAATASPSAKDTKQKGLNSFFGSSASSSASTPTNSSAKKNKSDSEKSEANSKPDSDVEPISSKKRTSESAKKGKKKDAAKGKPTKNTKAKNTKTKSAPPKKKMRRMKAISDSEESEEEEDEESESESESESGTDSPIAKREAPPRRRAAAAAMEISRQELATGNADENQDEDDEDHMEIVKETKTKKSDTDSCDYAEEEEEEEEEEEFEVEEKKEEKVEKVVEKVVEKEEDNEEEEEVGADSKEQKLSGWFQPKDAQRKRAQAEAPTTTVESDEKKKEEEGEKNKSKDAAKQDADWENNTENIEEPKKTETKTKNKNATQEAVESKTEVAEKVTNKSKSEDTMEIESSDEKSSEYVASDQEEVVKKSTTTKTKKKATQKRTPAKTKSKTKSKIKTKKSHETVGTKGVDNEDDEDELEEDEIEDVHGSQDSKLATMARVSKLSADNLPDKFDPSAAATWKIGAAVPYHALVKAFEAIEATTKRIQIQAILCRFFRSVIATTPDDLLACVYLACNKLAPAYEGMEIGVGDSFIIKVITNATGRSKARLQTDYEEVGDLGLIAEQSRSSQGTLFGFKPKPLAVSEVLKGYRTIATTSGNKSQDKKIGNIQKLFVRAEKKEVKYLVRGLQGKLRIGLAEQSVLTALAHALVLTPPSKTLPPPLLDARATMKKDALLAAMEDASHTVKRAYSELPSYDEVVGAALSVGLSNLLDVCHIRSGIPLKPMLAKPTKGISEVLDRFNGVAFTCEYKYDGERAQIHRMSDGTFRIYSRNSEDNTTKYPDVISALPSALKLKNSDDSVMQDEKVADESTEKTRENSEIIGEDAGKSGENSEKSGENSEKSDANPEKNGEIATLCLDTNAGDRDPAEEPHVSFILDSEVVAYDVTKATLLPFQILSTRARKNVEISDIKVSVIVCAFDLLYLNGKSLLRESFKERRRLLQDTFQEVPHKFTFAKGFDGTDSDDIQTFLTDAVDHSCEGLMIKTLEVDATYEPSRRSLNWLKLKKDYMDGVTDSLDLVPIGAFYGKGKRTGNYGAYLLAAYDEDEGVFQSVCKIGTGFSDVDLKTHFDYFSQRTIPKKALNVESVMDCDVWLDPCQVWEVLAADLSISPVHCAGRGKVDRNKGIALRFPRFIRIRTDKDTEQATNTEQVADMYRNQNLATQSGNMDDDDMF